MRSRVFVGPFPYPKKMVPTCCETVALAKNKLSKLLFSCGANNGFCLFLNVTGSKNGDQFAQKNVCLGSVLPQGSALPYGRASA